LVADLYKSQAKVKKLKQKVDDLQAKVGHQEDTIKRLKEQNNYLKQLIKGKTMRLFNFPMGEDEAADTGRALAARVYERVLKPLLTAAKAKNELSTVPQCNNVVDSIYRVGKPTVMDGVTRPSPIVIRLCSKQLHTAIMKCKREATPAPSTQEKAAGIRRFVVVEDLTAPTYKLLRELLEDDRVEKAWSVNGRLRYVQTGDDKSVKHVKSVFDPMDTILASKNKAQANSL
jgi:hypothetical protein